MVIQKEIDELLQKPLTRKQFLRHIGLIMLGLLGVNAVLSRLVHPEKHISTVKSDRGWGQGKFGA